MYDPIYSQNIGLVGYRCRCSPECRRVVPTYRGIVMHCKRVHGLVAQMEIADFKEEKNGKAESADDGVIRHAGRITDDDLDRAEARQRAAKD